MLKGKGKFISKEDLEKVLTKAQTSIDAKYNNGVESTKRNRITAEAANIVDDLYKRDEEELHAHKDDLFRKVRKVFINGIVFITPFFIGLPIKMMDEAIQRKVDLNNARNYNKIYDREILWAEKTIRDERSKGHDVTKLTSYKNNLVKGKAKMNTYIADLEKKEQTYEKVNESFNVITNEDCSTPYGVFVMFPDFDAKSGEDENVYNDKLFESFVACTETVREKIRDVVHKGRDAAGKVHDTAVNIDKAAEPLDNIVNNTIKNVKDSIRSDKRDEIVLGENRVKLLRVIGKALGYGGLILVHPALAAIAFLGKMAYDEHIDSKERQRILNDLEHEMTIVREKIKDAESKGDNENKYKLMRIENKLEREIARIKYRMDETA